jgi:diaminopimelate decarboxylase
VTNKTAPFLISNRLALFPDSTRIQNDSLTIAGLDVASLANEYGTPLYLYDRATADASVAAYRDALKAHYPAPSEVTYASKAFLCKALAEWSQTHKLWVDCTGEGEIAVAAAGGVSRERLLVHGVNKSLSDLQSSLRNAGTIVVDSLSELHRIAELSSQFANSRLPDLWLRLQPGLAVETHHAHTQTGQADSKFGMTAEEITQAAAFCRQHKLPLTGLHFHQGSHFRDPAPLLPAIELALDLASEIGFDQTWHLCPGGGWGVAYHEDELPQPEIEEYVRLIAECVIQESAARRLALPTLHLEPGRSLIARAGIAVYRVGAIKRRAGKTWILTDGGMADNPRRALYGARYSCLTVAGLSREISEQVSIAGPYCESGDVLIEDLLMPKVEEGELIAIPVSGAYHLSMASNYNGARRPAVVWLEENRTRLIIRRETIESLSQRDLSIT